MLSVFIWLNIVFTVCSTILFCKAYVLCPALFAEWRLLWEENKHYDSYIQLSLLPLEARSASNQGFSCINFFPKRCWQTKYVLCNIIPRDHLKSTLIYFPISGLSLVSLSTHFLFLYCFFIPPSCSLESTSIMDGPLSQKYQVFPNLNFY